MTRGVIHPFKPFLRAIIIISNPRRRLGYIYNNEHRIYAQAQLVWSPEYVLGRLFPKEGSSRQVSGLMSKTNNNLIGVVGFINSVGWLME